MKTLLVPTDFSEAADNAAMYAAGLAKLSGASLVLFHAYHVPTIISEQVVALPSMDEIEQECYKRLSALKEKIDNMPGGDIPITYLCRCGFAADEISLVSKEIHADLIIAGMRGSGYITDKLFGNVTTALIHKPLCPMLVISKQVTFKAIDKIVFAYDFHKLSDKYSFTILKELADLFLSHLYILNIENQPDLIEYALKKIRETKLQHWLNDVYATFHTVQHKNVSEGLSEFIKEHEAGLLVMMPREHSFFETILHRSETDKMAYQVNIPLLIIHE